MTAATFDPLRLAAEVEVWLNQHGVATVAGGGASALEAATALLVALGVNPVDEHQPIRYRVMRVTGDAVAGDPVEAEDLAHVLRMMRRDTDDEVFVEVLTLTPALTPAVAQ
jgi:hypothetical protein